MNLINTNWQFSSLICPLSCIFKILKAVRLIWLRGVDFPFHLLQFLIQSWSHVCAHIYLVYVHRLHYDIENALKTDIEMRSSNWISPWKLCTYAQTCIKEWHIFVSGFYKWGHMSLASFINDACTNKINACSNAYKRTTQFSG